MPKGTLGTHVLTNKLTKVLFTHIKTALPEIQKEIREKIRDLEDRLRLLGPPMPIESQEKVQLLWGMITTFCTSYNNSISGKYEGRKGTRRMLTGELEGGAKVKLLFYSLYKEYTIGGKMAGDDYSVKRLFNSGRIMISKEPLSCMKEMLYQDFHLWMCSSFSFIHFFKNLLSQLLRPFKRFTCTLRHLQNRYAKESS
jgi:hypothetical protein